MHFTCIEINRASQSQNKALQEQQAWTSEPKEAVEGREAYEPSVTEIEQAKSKKQKLHNSRLAYSIDVKNQHREDSGDISEKIDNDYSTLQQSLLNEVMQPSP